MSSAPPAEQPRYRPGMDARSTRVAAALETPMLIAAALLGAVSYGVWYALDSALGRGLFGQIVSVLTALTAGFAVYAVTVWAMRLPEALQIKRLLLGCFPWKFKGGEAAFCRAVAWVGEWQTP